MNTKAVFGVGVFGLAIAGCATLLGEKSVSCSAPVCHVTVAITDCTITNPEPVHIAKGTHDILWTIHSTGRPDFTANGIRFGTGTNGVFSNPNRPGAGMYRWTDYNDPNAPAKYYKYTIEITSGGKTCSIDPDVMND
jgi:hypothetical protein